MQPCHSQTHNVHIIFFEYIAGKAGRQAGRQALRVCILRACAPLFQCSHCCPCKRIAHVWCVCVCVLERRRSLNPNVISYKNCVRKFVGPRLYPHSSAARTTSLLNISSSVRSGAHIAPQLSAIRKSTLFIFVYIYKLRVRCHRSLGHGGKKSYCKGASAIALCCQHYTHGRPNFLQ